MDKRLEEMEPCKHDWAYIDAEDFTGRFCFNCHKSEKALSGGEEK